MAQGAFPEPGGTSADDSPVLRALLRGPGPLHDRLRRARDLLGDDTDADGNLSALLSALSVAQAQEHSAMRAQIQKAQFLAQHARAAAQPPSDRLRGDAHALGRMLAAALGQVPKGRRAALLDGASYLAANPDVAAAGADPVAHYIASGAAEGRAPGDLRAQYPDSHADPERPATLRGLDKVTRPGFSEDYPDALRQEALHMAARDGRRISVVIPCWNRRHVVADAVASALLQSRAPFEVIVVDDGSTDGTPDLLRARFPEPLAEGRLVLLEEPHAGVSAARNAGLARAQGDTIAYLDSDNTWEPDHLLFACAGLKGGAGAAYTALCRHELDHGWSDILFRRFDRATLEAENFIDLNSFVHARALYGAKGGFDTGLTRFVDWDLILRYSAHAAPVAVPVVTGHYFIGGAGSDSITRDVPAEPNLARIRARLDAKG